MGDNMEKLTGKEICDIIKACHTYEVREYKMNDIEIKFGESQTVPQTVYVPTPYKPSDVVPEPSEDIESDIAEKIDAGFQSFHAEVNNAKLFEDSLDV